MQQQLFPSNPLTLDIPSPFTFIQDSGHGWLAVPMAVLSELCITSQISRYSYKHGGMAYLEEDLDFGTFSRAFEKFYGVKPSIHDAPHVDHWIGRESYAPFSR